MPKEIQHPLYTQEIRWLMTEQVHCPPLTVTITEVNTFKNTHRCVYEFLVLNHMFLWDLQY